MNVNLGLLKATLGIESKSNDDKDMLEFILRRVVAIQEAQPEAEWEVRYDNYGNLYVTKGTVAPGEVYPSVVCHIDTVHERTDHFSIQEYSGYKDGTTVLYAMNMYKVQQVGIGGDDKVGVYICLHLLETLSAAKMVFFRNEEIGCLGSREADLSYFDNCAFVLQADRRGSRDFIRTGSGAKLFSRKFERAIRPYLRRYDFECSDEGAGSDTPTLKHKGIKICVANVSCGYFKPHSKEEFVVVGDVERTLNLFADICQNLANRTWRHVWHPEPKYYGYYDRDAKKWVRPEDKDFNKKKAIAYAKEQDEKWSKNGYGNYSGYGYYGGDNYYSGRGGNQSTGGTGRTGYGYGNQGYGHTGSRVEDNKPSGRSTGTGTTGAGATGKTTGATSSGGATKAASTASTARNNAKDVKEGQQLPLALPQGRGESTGNTGNTGNTTAGSTGLTNSKNAIEGSYRVVDGETGEVKSIAPGDASDASHGRVISVTTVTPVDTGSEEARLRRVLFHSEIKEVIKHCEMCRLDCIIHLPHRHGYYCDNCDSFVPYPEVVMRRGDLAARAVAVSLKTDMDDGELFDILQDIIAHEEFASLNWEHKYDA